MVVHIEGIGVLLFARGEEEERETKEVMEEGKEDAIF
jgi:hypothetical protein